MKHYKLKVSYFFLCINKMTHTYSDSALIKFFCVLITQKHNEAWAGPGLFLAMIHWWSSRTRKRQIKPDYSGCEVIEVCDGGAEVLCSWLCVQEKRAGQRGSVSKHVFFIYYGLDELPVKPPPPPPPPPWPFPHFPVYWLLLHCQKKHPSTFHFFKNETLRLKKNPVFHLHIPDFTSLSSWACLSVLKSVTLGLPFRGLYSLYQLLNYLLL